MDFFEKRNLSELSLIDKINLITKVGARISIPLTKVEQEFLDMANACETWDEVVVCAEAIYEYSKENETRNEDDEALVPQTMSMDGEEEDEDGNGGMMTIQTKTKSRMILVTLTMIQKTQTKTKILFPR